MVACHISAATFRHCLGHWIREFLSRPLRRYLSNHSPSFIFSSRDLSDPLCLLRAQRNPHVASWTTATAGLLHWPCISSETGSVSNGTSGVGVSPSHTLTPPSFLVLSLTNLPNASFQCGRGAKPLSTNRFEDNLSSRTFCPRWIL